MSQFWINFIFVIGSFIIYTAIAVWARAKSTREFYIAGGEVNPVMNGMAEGMESNMSWSCPPMRSVSAGALPL